MRIDNQLSGGFVNVTLSTKEVVILFDLVQRSLQDTRRPAQHMLTLKGQLEKAATQAMTNKD